MRMKPVYYLTAHIVLVTKYRRKVINFPVSTRLKEIFQEICCKSGCVLKEFNAELDHVHLLISYSPQMLLNKFVADLKTISTRLLLKEFSEHLNHYYGRQPVFWNASYFIASCGSVTVEQLRKYVEFQQACPQEGEISY